MSRAASPNTRHRVPVIAAVSLASVVAACGTSPAPAKPVAPSFTSATTAAFVVGKSADFAITTSASRADHAKVTMSGRLPAGLTFLATKRGAMLEGMPAAGSAGNYSLTIKVRDSAGHAAQLLALTVMQVPQFGSHPSIMVTAGLFTTTSVAVTGFPAASVTESGALPAGLQFKVLPNGTAVISGTPAVSGGTVTRTITLTAANSAGAVHENISVTVFQPAPPPPPVAPPPPPMGIPQGNGGDHDADNNGGFNDGDGDI
jgi:Putative Ig domain